MREVLRKPKQSFQNIEKKIFLGVLYPILLIYTMQSFRASKTKKTNFLSMPMN